MTRCEELVDIVKNIWAKDGMGNINRGGDVIAKRLLLEVAAIQDEATHHIFNEADFGMTTGYPPNQVMLREVKFTTPYGFINYTVDPNYWIETLVASVTRRINEKGIGKGDLGHIVDADIQQLVGLLYDHCSTHRDCIPILKQRFNVMGIDLKWVMDPENPEKELIVLIESPYGYVTIYSNQQAFKEMGEAINSCPEIGEYAEASKRDDQKEMARLHRKFKRKMWLGNLLKSVVRSINKIKGCVK